MGVATTQALATGSPIGRALTQQGVGGRAQALRNRMIRRVVALVVLALSLSIVQVWSRMQVLQMRYAMTGMQKRVEDLQQQINRMELAVTALKAPDRLERVAREQLGLQVPTPGQVIFVREHADGESRDIGGDQRVGGAAPAGQ